MFSLWAESDKYGGLSLSSQDVGQVLSITGKTYYFGTFISAASIVLCMCWLFYHNWAPLDARERKARAFESHRGFLPCI